MLNELTVTTYFELSKVIYEESYKIVCMLNAADSIEGFKHLEFIGWDDDDDIHFKGEDDYSYNKSTYTFKFPAMFLYDSEALDIEIDNRRKARSAREDTERKYKERQIKERQDRLDFEQWKKDNGR